MLSIQGRAWLAAWVVGLAAGGICAGAGRAARLDLAAAYGAQYERLAGQMAVARANRDGQRRVLAEALRREAAIWPSDRDPLDIVLRRTKALVGHLRGMAGGPEPCAGEAAEASGERSGEPPADGAE